MNQDIQNVFCHKRIALYASRFYLYQECVQSNWHEITLKLEESLIQIMQKAGIKLKIKDPKDLSIQIQKAHYTLQKNSSSYEKCIISKNIKYLSKELNFNSSEELLLEFAVYLAENRDLEYIFQVDRGSSSYEYTQLLAAILKIKPARVRKALSSKSQLILSGILLKPYQHYQNSIFEKLRLPSDFSEKLLIADINKKNLLSSILRKAGKSSLSKNDFDYIHHHLHLITNYLKTSMAKKKKSVNILLYGSPGTGKTELSKVISNQLDCPLFEIPSQYEGEILTGAERLARYQLNQYLLRNKKALILFDEIEDIFPVRMFSNFGKYPGKAYINEILENNPVPAIWVSNQVRQIDPAYLRRFDMIFELESPPIDIRKKIINQSFKDLPVSQSWIEQLASYQNISPALTRRISSVAINIEPEKGVKFEDYINIMYNQSLKSMGYETIKTIDNDTNEFQLNLINTDIDLNNLVKLLKLDSSARICLYGPPGTGKTAFARFISEKIGSPLLLKRASDLLDPYVGGTEMKISAAFTEATNNKAVLLIDEADSFLQKRINARQTWQVTQVNEFLTQMETYQGLLICTTNLMDHLDEASMRRFDLKIKLDYLNQAQTWQLFQQTLEKQDIKNEIMEHVKQQLSTISNLTPGDFALIKRANKVLKKPLSPESLLKKLKKEVSYKAVKHTGGIGFMSELDSL